MRFLFIILVGVSTLGAVEIAELGWTQVIDSQNPGFTKVKFKHRKLEIPVFLDDDLQVTGVFSLNKNFYLIKVQDKGSPKLKAFQVFFSSSSEPVLLHETPLREGSSFTVPRESILFRYDFVDPLDPSPPRSQIENEFHLDKKFLKLGEERLIRAPGLRGYHQELKYFLDQEDFEEYGTALQFLEKALVQDSLFLLQASLKQEELARVLLLKANFHFKLQKPETGFSIYQRILKNLPKTRGALVAQIELERAKRLGREVYLRLR